MLNFSFFFTILSQILSIVAIYTLTIYMVMEKSFIKYNLSSFSPVNHEWKVMNEDSPKV